MRRILLVSSLLAGLVTFGSKPSQAAISADINLHIGHRAPRVYFQRQPRGYIIPNSDVYYYGDSGYDMYRYGNIWYVNDGGYWYSSRSWRGPFIGVRFESVPTRIIRVPSRYHRGSRGWSNHQVWDNGPRYRDRNDRRWNGNDRRWNDNDRRRRDHDGNWNNDDRRRDRDGSWNDDDRRDNRRRDWDGRDDD